MKRKKPTSSEPSKRRKRSIRSESPEKDTRASEPKTPASHEQADKHVSKSSNQDERAVYLESSNNPERDTPRESPRPLDRVSHAATSIRKERANAPESTIPNELPRTRAQEFYALKKAVRMFYDLQRLRLQCGGRLLKRAEGQTIELHPSDVSDLHERLKELETAERHMLANVARRLKGISFYNSILSDKVRYRGIGPTMAGVILAELSIEKADTASKMWAFAGLRPMPAYRCKACHELVAIENETSSREERATPAEPPQERSRARTREPSIINVRHIRRTKCESTSYYASGKAQRPTAGEKLPYNSFLRSKLVGVLGPVLLKVGSPWRKFYDDYKHRKQSAGWGISDGHRHNAAIRYMIKMLLLDIWREWRAHEGLPVRPSYQEEYLGHTHHADAKSNESTEVGERISVDDEITAEMEHALWSSLQRI